MKKLNTLLKISIVVVSVILGLIIHRFRGQGYSIMNIYDRWNGLIPFLGGIYAFLLARGILPRNQQKKEKMENWRKKYGNLLIVLSSFLVIGGSVELFKKTTIHSFPPINLAEIKWHTAECPELNFIINFPGNFKEYTVPLENGGKVFGITSTLGSDYKFDVVCLDNPAEKMTESEFFQDFKDKDDFRIEREFEAYGHRVVEGTGKSKRFSMFRLFYVNKISYMIMVEGDKHPDSDLKRNIYISSLLSG